MSQEYWQQQADKPLFPDLIWSRPETKKGAGKLLIIGGQAQEFANVAEVYMAARAAGAGTIRVFMPHSTQKFTKMLPNIEYAASNKSGSFAKESLADLLEASQWADGVILAGDLGKNSETSLMLENFILKYQGLLIISDEALPSLNLDAKDLFRRKSTVLALHLKSLQKFGAGLQLEKPITSTINNSELAARLHEITNQYPASLAVLSNFVWTSHNGRVSNTKPKPSENINKLTAKTAVWAIQNPSKMFEAITASVS